MTSASGLTSACALTMRQKVFGRCARAGATLLDAGATDGPYVARAAKAAAHLLDGLKQLLRRHLARFALVRPRSANDAGGAALLVPRIPGLDGAKGKLKASAVLVEEGLFTDVPDASHDGGARR